jgi:Flp pilus assembly protein CpaB
MPHRRLRLPSLVPLAIAVVCAVAVVGVMRAYTRRLELAHPAVGAPVTVQVATRALTRGTLIASDMLRAEQIPAAFVPPAAVAAQDQLVGHTLAADVAAGDAVTRTRLAGTSAGPVAALVPPDLRAILITSDLPAGAVAPGDRVDVLAAFGGGRGHVETVADDVEVARVMAPLDGALAGTQTTSGPSLVLLVDPGVAQDLAYAVAFARLVVTVDPPGLQDAPQVSPRIGA